MTVDGQAPVSYTYDAASHLRTIAQAPLTPVSIDYDALGRRTLLTLPNGVSTEYQYDAASRLTALIYQNALGLLGDLTYQYDSAGNRLGVGGSFARTLLPEPVSSTTYDAANEQLAFGDQAMTFDANGNLETIADATGTATFTWDARNRLAAIIGPTGSANFAYDAFGRRTQKVAMGKTSQFQYDRLDIIKELSNGTGVSYVRTLDIDEVLVRDDGTLPLIYLLDPLGNTVALTNTSGAIATSYTYEPFGRTISSTIGDPNQFGFTGRENDGTGFYYYRARYYSTALHRFVSEDQLDISLVQLLRQDPRTSQMGAPLFSHMRVQSHTRNPFLYVAANPTRFRDPLGLINFIGGVGGSATAPTGAEGSVGIVFNPGWFGYQADVGVFGSAGPAAGVNVSYDLFVGFIKGGIEDVKGETVNVNLVLGPPIPLPISITMITDPKTGETIGWTFGYGPTATPVGVSGAYSVTRTFTLRDLLGFLFGGAVDISGRKSQ